MVYYEDGFLTKWVRALATWTGIGTPDPDLSGREDSRVPAPGAAWAAPVRDPSSI